MTVKAMDVVALFAKKNERTIQEQKEYFFNLVEKCSKEAYLEGTCSAELMEEMIFSAFVLLEMDNNLYYKTTVLASKVLELLSLPPHKSLFYLQKASEKRVGSL